MLTPADWTRTDGGLRAPARPLPAVSIPAQERRSVDQPDEREIGRLVSCGGSRGVIAARAGVGTAAWQQRWSVGSLISIQGAGSRIVCFVYDMETPGLGWQPGENIVHVKIELVGEVYDGAQGRLSFRRGIASYPTLGSAVHPIRHADLAAIYDLGDRQGARVGSLSQDRSIDATVNIEDMLRKHFAVVGTTGVGKSVSVSILLRQALAAKPNLRILILDPHNEFSTAFAGQCVTMDASTLELPFWMFKFDEIADVIFRGRAPAEGEADFLREAITQAKAMYSTRSSQNQPNSILKKAFSPDASNVSPDSPFPYRIADIFKLIDDETGKLETKYSRFDLRALRSRIDALWHNPRYRFMFGKASLEDTTEPLIANLFRIPDRGLPVTVLQLAGIPADVVNAVVSVLARIAFDIAMMSNGRYEILVLCEEAHRYVPADIARGFVPTRLAISRIAKEGRKYGCYLGVVTQRPSELDPTILSQCSTVFAMRLANDRDQEIIRAAIPDSSAGVLTFLSAISNREAIAFGEGIATPMRIRFEEQQRTQVPLSIFGGNENASLSTGGLMDLHSIVDRMRGNSSDDPSASYTPAGASDRGFPSPMPAPMHQMPSAPAQGKVMPKGSAPLADYRHLLGREIER